MDIEAGLISKIKSKEDLMYLLDEQITDKFFLQYSEVYNEIISHYKKYQTVPDLEVIANAFPKFIPSNSEQPIEFFVDRLKSRFKLNLYKDGLGEAIPLLSSGNVEDAEKIIQSIVSTSKREVKSGKDLDIRMSTDSRMEDYLSKKEFYGIDGIRSGWESLDDLTLGYHPGDLVTFIAETKKGKTWLLTYQAHEIWWNQRIPVLFLTKEMHPEAIRKRFDAIHCKLPYDSLRRGQLDPKQESVYFDYLEKVKDDDIPFVVLGYSLDDTSATVSSLVPKVERYLSDGGILFVDGLYLMDDDRGETDWRGIVNIAKDLKNLAQKYSIPVITSSQAKIEGKSYIPNMENIAYGKYIAQYVDALLSIAQDAQAKVAEMLYIFLLAQREGDVGNWVINFQFNPFIDFSEKKISRVGIEDSDDSIEI